MAEVCFVEMTCCEPVFCCCCYQVPRSSVLSCLASSIQEITLELQDPQKYTAFVMNGNGAKLLGACLERRPAWRLHVRGTDQQEAWNFWWGSNGQYCPFKRLVKGVQCPHRNHCDRVVDLLFQHLHPESKPTRCIISQLKCCRGVRN